MDDYIPVSCSFHDELEALATLRQDCHVVYRNDTDEINEARGRIVDVYAANHADYIRLQNGTEIRLDRLISVNDKRLEDYSNS
jgi:Rho-binding antiterminator